MKLCMQAKKLYPTLISGYDLVGPEDHGRTLHSLTSVLVWFQSELRRQNLTIPFFLHAGECVGDGDSTDQNLYDAILLKTRRIGHAFSLYKHPLIIDMVKEKKIMVECCPISNEVLRYTASIKMHPLPALLARGVKAAIANDDPSMMGQGTAGLAHDFWQALQGWENLGLAGLVSAFLLLLLACIELMLCADDYVLTGLACAEQCSLECIRGSNRRRVDGRYFSRSRGDKYSCTEDQRVGR